MSMSKQKALVTGGAGFIGSHLCTALLERGWEVTCLDNFSTGLEENIKHLAEIKLINGDVNEGETFERLDKEFDVIFHYAATVGVKRTEENPSAVLADVRGMCHIARLAKEGAFKKIIFTSSSEVYGEPKRVPESEEDGVIGWSPYTVVKLYGEHLFAALWREHKIPTVSLRFFNVYGPRQIGSAYGFVTARFVQQVMSGKAPTVFGNGKQTRDFVYVADNVQAALAAVDCEEAWGQVINVGSGKETRICDLAETIIEAVDKTGKLKAEYLPARAVEIDRRCASTDKMRELLKVNCDISLEDGIKRTVEEYDTEEIIVNQQPKLAVQETI